MSSRVSSYLLLFCCLCHCHFSACVSLSWFIWIFVHLFHFLIILLQRKPNDVAAVGFIWNNFLPKENQRSGREKERERERERERNKITLQIEIEMDSFALWKKLSNPKKIVSNSSNKVSILLLVCRAIRYNFITFNKHFKKFRSTYWMLGEHYLPDIYPIRNDGGLTKTY